MAVNNILVPLLMLFAWGAPWLLEWSRAPRWTIRVCGAAAVLISLAYLVGLLFGHQFAPGLNVREPYGTLVWLAGGGVAIAAGIQLARGRTPGAPSTDTGQPSIVQPSAEPEATPRI
jgi:hypothetical protein